MNLQPIEAGRHLGDSADRQAGARESLGARPPQLNLAGPAARERELTEVKSRASRKRRAVRKQNREGKVAGLEDAHQAPGRRQGPTIGDLSIGAQPHQRHVQGRPQAVRGDRGARLCVTRDQAKAQEPGRTRLQDKLRLLQRQDNIHRPIPIPRRKNRQTTGSAVGEAEGRQGAGEGMNPQLKPPIRIGPGSKRRHSLELHLQLTLSKRSAIEIDQPMTGQVALLRLEDELLGILEQDPLPADRLGVAGLASSVKKKERVEQLELPGSLGKRQPERTPLIGKKHPPRTGTHEAAAPGDLELGLVQEGMIINPGPDSQGRVGQPAPIGSQDRQGNRQRTTNIKLDAIAGPRPAGEPAQDDQVGRIPRDLGLCPAAAGILAAMQNADLGRIPGMVDLDMRPQARVFGLNLGKPEASIPGRPANHRSQRREARP